jgi:Ca-activated chloride channel homolog
MGFGFAHPWVLAGLAGALPAAGWLQHCRHQRALRFASQWGAMQPAGTPPHPWAGRAFAAALFCFIVALANPGWGEDTRAGISRGRDLAIAIDLSRSMAAADMLPPEFPTRAQAACEAVRIFLNHLENHGGGYRVALIAFANQAVIVTPLTLDYAHLRDRLRELSVAAPPPGLYPDEDAPFRSGTRFRAALQTIVQTADSRFPGFHDGLIISDGDDPAPDRDFDVASGLASANQARVSVFTVGVGDHTEGSMIIVDEQPVRTRQETEVLLRIAEKSEATYQNAGTALPDLVLFFHTAIAGQLARERPEEARAVRQSRAVWCIVPGLALLFFAIRRGP